MTQDAQSARTPSSTRTGLGRSLDPRHPISRRGLVGSIAAGALTLGIALVGSGTFDVRPAVMAGIAVFLAWAIARELDPDRPRSADAAMVAAALLTIGGELAIGAVAITLLAVRLIAGTVGRRLYPPDAVVLVIVAGFGGSKAAAWPAVALLIGVLAIDRSLARLVPVAMGVIAITTAAVAGATPQLSATAGSLGLAVAAVMASLLPVRHVETATDSGKRTIEPQRVHTARLSAGALVVAGGLLAPEGAWAMAPVGAALMGTVVGWATSRQSGEARDTRAAKSPR